MNEQTKPQGKTLAETLAETWMKPNNTNVWVNLAQAAQTWFDAQRAATLKQQEGKSLAQIGWEAVVKSNESLPTHMCELYVGIATAVESAVLARLDSQRAVSAGEFAEKAWEKVARFYGTTFKKQVTLNLAALYRECCPPVLVRGRDVEAFASKALEIARDINLLNETKHNEIERLFRECSPVADESSPAQNALDDLHRPLALEPSDDPGARAFMVRSEVERLKNQATSESKPTYFLTAERPPTAEDGTDILVWHHNRRVWLQSTVHVGINAEIFPYWMPQPPPPTAPVPDDEAAFCDALRGCNNVSLTAMKNEVREVWKSALAHARREQAKGGNSK